MASTATRYPNSSASASEKERSADDKFSLIDDVRNSTLAARHRDLIVSMMLKNQFGDELWMETNHIAAVLGRLCQRRHPGTITRTVKGKQQIVVLGPCKTASRRTVQRLIDELVYCQVCRKASGQHADDHTFVPQVEGGGVLDERYGANSYVPYGGGKKFRPSATYRICRERLQPRKTSAEYTEQRERARKRKVPQHIVEMPHSKPPTPAAPAPKAPAKVAQDETNPVTITRDVRIALTTMFVAFKKSGMDDAANFAEIVRQMRVKFPELTAEQVRIEVSIQSAKKMDQEERRDSRETRAERISRKNREANQRVQEKLRRQFEEGG